MFLTSNKTKTVSPLKYKRLVITVQRLVITLKN